MQRRLSVEQNNITIPHMSLNNITERQTLRTARAVSILNNIVLETSTKKSCKPLRRIFVQHLGLIFSPNNKPRDVCPPHSEHTDAECQYSTYTIFFKYKKAKFDLTKYSKTQICRLSVTNVSRATNNEQSPWIFKCPLEYKQASTRRAQMAGCCVRFTKLISYHDCTIWVFGLFKPIRMQQNQNSSICTFFQFSIFV